MIRRVEDTRAISVLMGSTTTHQLFLSMSMSDLQRSTLDLCTREMESCAAHTHIVGRSAWWMCMNKTTQI